MELSRALIEDLAKVAFDTHAVATDDGWRFDCQHWQTASERTKDAWRKVAAAVAGATKNAQAKQLLEAQNVNAQSTT